MNWIPSDESLSTFVSEPRRIKLSMPTIVQSGYLSRNDDASVEPTNPQLPVMRSFKWPRSIWKNLAQISHESTMIVPMKRDAFKIRSGILVYVGTGSLMEFNLFQFGIDNQITCDPRLSVEIELGCPIFQLRRMRDYFDDTTRSRGNVLFRHAIAYDNHVRSNHRILTDLPIKLDDDFARAPLAIDTVSQVSREPRQYLLMQSKRTRGHRDRLSLDQFPIPLPKLVIGHRVAGNKSSNG